MTVETCIIMEQSIILETYPNISSFKPSVLSVIGIVSIIVSLSHMDSFVLQQKIYKLYEIEKKTPFK